MKFIILALILRVILSIDNKCADNQCKDPPDPNLKDLIDWYEAWESGYVIDYIKIEDLREFYDFIGIGAGITGSVVAHRLAMDKSYPTVLLLGAGREADNAGLSNGMIPIQIQLDQLTDIDWQYSSESSDGLRIMELDNIIFI